MLLDVIFNGYQFLQSTEEYLRESGVPGDVIDDAKVAAKRKLISEDRDQRLFETDWTQFSDSPLGEGMKAEFAEYRQKLRDIPQDYPNPDDVVWPEKPAV